MSLPAPLQRWQRAVRVRRASIALVLLGAPLTGALALAARLGGARAAFVLAAVGVVALALVLVLLARRDERRWLAHRLDALAPVLEDSAALLWHADATLEALPRLQRARLVARLADLELEPRPPWPRRALAFAALAGTALVALALGWPAAPSAPPAPRAADAAPPTAAAPRLVAARLTITPPAYTGLPARSESELDARVVQDARLDWQLELAPPPQRAWLAFHDGSRLELQRDGALWRGSRTLAAATLYRIELDPAPALAEPLHRIDVIADRAPTIRVIAPAHGLTLHDDGQTQWPLEFEAEDDYGLAAAELVLTHAQGTGENVTFHEQRVPLQGEALAGARRERYRHRVDLAALGFAAGDELVARLEVRDNRVPVPNTTRGSGLILRWPAPASADSAGLEGISQQVLPAYFRSQRQIIIDTETLIGEQPQLAPARFLARSDAIGVDQKILRLRYGQFLGEEAEGAAHAAVEAGHAEADSQLGALADVHEASERHAEGGRAFGEAGDVLTQFGHVHDIAEAATLLDPQTRATLKAALDQMWQAELHLRQGAPAAALPYEERALDLVKQAQQATRIYLARVGLELPRPDEARRLSGERAGVTDVDGSLVAAPTPATALTPSWQSLAADVPPDWDAVARAVRDAAPDDAQALDVLAALDRAQREPGCAPCRERLRAALWPLLPTPPAAVTPRALPDAAGAAWLEALSTPAQAQP